MEPETLRLSRCPESGECTKPTTEPPKETDEGVGEAGGTGVAEETESLGRERESRGWRFLMGTNPITRF